MSTTRGTRRRASAQVTKRALLISSNMNAYHNERGPDGDVETLEFFTKRVGDISKIREDVKTSFDYLDLDDHVTFGGNA
jgi:hypothetical protein